MNDQEIRNILISFLKGSNDNMRIYQEKAIGGSICDLMSVTDCLTGYEIKSDQDDYSRLDRQVNSYDHFFNYNYIVVGKSHERSVEEKVPKHWGIIVVSPDNIYIYKKAKQNKYPNIKSQLSVLWKLELGNLLSFFRLPMYSLKSKSFISDRLIESVAPEELSERIAYELFNRDYSIFDAEDYTVTKENETIPDTYTKEMVDGVSEMEEMTLDKWIEIFNSAQKVKRTKEEKFRLRKDRPAHDITFDQIEVSLGVPWISSSIISDFAKYLATIGTENKSIEVFINVSYEQITGNWYVHNKNDASINVNCTTKYGLRNYNALWILEATLNLREIKLYDKYKNYDEKSTIAALERQKRITELFKKWVWEDEDRKWEIEEAYNNLFGKYKTQRFDGSGLEFPGLNKEKDLYGYQKDAVQRIVSCKNTLLAFDVGAGKTYIMIAAAMLMRKNGISRKNMFVVPNNIVGQWAKIFTDMYPEANLLVIEPKSFKSPVRDKAMKQMQYGDYDGIIIAYSCFEMIPVSAAYIENKMNEKIQEINDEIKRIRYEPGSGAALEREKNRLWKLCRELIAGMDYETFDITFEDLEINTLFLDEAHNYKNLPLYTKMKNIRGINVKGSKKCLDMFQKVRYVQDSDTGRGVVFATGTPLCNSIADTYVMQMYLQGEELAKSKLDIFDNWIKTFARPQKVAEVDVDTQHYRFVTRFAKFFNLPELSRMFSNVAVFHAMDKEDGVPEKEEYRDEVIKKNSELKDYMFTLAQRTDAIRSGIILPSVDNMLKVSTDGRKAALDLRLTDREQHEETSKIIRCIANVKKIYDGFEGCSQLVFCDYSTPKKDKFNVYAAVKDGLTGMGIPEKEIAFIHSYHTEERKVKLFNDVNEGKIRVLIGSTFKLGIGANVQSQLKAIHHLDVPWRPADMVQREGRILRKGNQYDEVYIYRYICEGSFDAYSWQILETKQKFISQFLNGSAYQRSSEDLEENVLSFAELKALALSDPRMKDLAEKENELANLRILSSKFAETKMQMKDDIEAEEKAVVLMEKQINATEINCKDVSGWEKDDHKSFKAAVAEFLDPVAVNESGRKLGSAIGFHFHTPDNQSESKPYFVVSKNGASYMIESGKSASGNAQRVVNLLKGFDKYLKDLHKKLEAKRMRIEQMKEKVEEENPYIEQVKEMEREIEKLKGEIGE